MTANKPEAKRRDPRRSRPRTMVAYLVYPPSFQPGSGCKWYRNRQRAIRAALQLGAGSEIYRDIRTVRKRCEQCRIEPLWVVEPSHDNQ